MDFQPGEIAAVVGENGAGKSTLMNVLSGLYQPDGGEILVDGQPAQFRSPRDAIAKGIGMVHQHFMLVPPLTVAENVVLGMEPRRHGLLDLDAADQAVRKTCERFGFSLPVEERVEDLTVGSQQKVEIIKVLYRGARVLILDEPTAVLTPQESEDLFSVMRELASTGHTVVLISHKLREVLAAASRIYVMRRGKLVAQAQASSTNEQELAALMVGDARPREVRPTTRGRRGELLLEVKDLHAPGTRGLAALRGVSLSVFAGEVVGIAGVDGNGQRELAEVITGLRSFDSGLIRFEDKVLPSLSPGQMRRLGMSHVPEDRQARAIIGPMTVEENVALGRDREPPFARGRLIDFEGRQERALKLLEEFDVRPPDPLARIGLLSGGNQQKVVLARELDVVPKLLVVVQPTRGLDISAVGSVHDRLLQARERGAGILLISLDLEEILALSDRLYAIFEGRITGHLERAQFEEKRVGRLMMGAESEPYPSAPRANA
ncbi:MAG TPA: ABC transporter ATP-binding protein [Myxococcaceae bacterium]|nr:ABC transporter ATP-binding protein [Myxococcaceae bacterium]